MALLLGVRTLYDLLFMSLHNCYLRLDARFLGGSFKVIWLQAQGTATALLAALQEAWTRELRPNFERDKTRELKFTPAAAQLRCLCINRS